MEIKDGMNIKSILDLLLQNQSTLYNKEIRVATVQGMYVGEIHERTSEVLVLKTNLRSKVIEGLNKGKSVMQYSCILLQSIIGITYEQAE